MLPQPKRSDAEILDRIAALSANAPHADTDAVDTADFSADDAEALEVAFREAAARRLVVPETVLLPWIRVADVSRVPDNFHRVGQQAIRAAGFCPTPKVVEVLRAVLRGGGIECQVLAASALGRAGDTASAGQIVELLGTLQRSEHWQRFAFVAIAVEQTGDGAAARRLQEMIPTAPEWAVYWLNRAIHTLTGHSAPRPDVDWRADADAYRADLREAWAMLDLAAPPAPAVIWGHTSAFRAEAVVHGGRNVFALAPDDEGATSSWPEWNYSWCYDRRRLYRVGSVCSTCEVWLSRVGWAPRHAVELAQAVRAAVADLQSLDAALLTALEPLLGALASSRYELRLIDLPLEPVTWPDTWYAAEILDEAEEGGTSRSDLDTLYHPPHSGQRHPLVIAPTQADLDPATVEKYEHAIAAGTRPAAVAAAYIAERQAWDADEPHVSLAGFVIDGHHKLAAYANQGIAARIILICDRTPPLPTALDPTAAFDRILGDAGTRDVG